MSLLPPDSTRKPAPPSASQSEKSRAKPQLLVVPLEDRVVPAGQVVGTVFLDFNANGLLDTAGTLANNGSGSTPLPADTGVGGVVVTAYDSANAVQGSATSAANGQYTLALGNTGPYRLEFTSLPTGLFYGPQGAGTTGSGTGVQFVPDNPPATPVNLGLVRPSAITADNPLLVTNEYRFGDRTGIAATEATILSFPYSAGTVTTETDIGALTPYADPTTHQIAVTHGQVGATWGLAFDGVSDSVYAAAFTKRHVGYGPSGTGAIYQIAMPSAATPTVTTATLFVDLGAAAGGADFRGGGGAGYDYTTDQNDIGWDAVGKTGLGGLVVDEAGDFMYTVGLADRRLYRIAINPGGTAGNVTSFAIPLPVGANGVTGIGGVGGALGDLRPFAVEVHDGIVYVGAVNSAESTGLASDLRAFVFAFNPTALSGAGAFVNLAGLSTTTEAVFTAQLDYARGYAHPGDTNPPTDPGTVIPGAWNAWTPTRTTLADIAGANERYGIYPQPELTGLAFDDAGNITLGLRDRAGDQFGNFLTFDFPGTPAPGTKGISAGDTLRVFINTPGNTSSGWTLESNGNGTGGAGNGQGPGGGEFFFQENLPPNAFAIDDHTELTVGGVLQLPGRDQVLVTLFDPIPVAGQYDAGGVRWFDTADGTQQKAYRLFQAGDPNTFAKSNGIGDLIAATQLGREIGNRVWNDANGNGRQDAGEAGIQNVSVVLCQVVGGVSTPVATATTDANGDYYFSSYSGVSTANKRFGVTQLGGVIPAGTSYEICIPVADPALAGLQLTPFRNAGTNTQNDSDGVLSGGNYVIQTVGTQRNGTAQHANDVGFLVANASLSGFVYEDSNPSNTLNAGDTPLAGVTVVLSGVTSGGTTITPQTATTDGTGAYSFTGLAGGTYTVTETQPGGYLNRGEQPGSTGGTAPQNGTVISAIPLAPGQASINNNFGEVLPAQLSGNVYHDITNDGTFNAGDALIPNVTLLLTGTDDLGAAVSVQQVSGTGAYAFTALRPGDYTVSETQPTGFVTRTNNPGTAFTPGTGTPGTVVGDAIQTIRLNSNANSPNNNFGEVLAANAQLSGFVYIDADNDGTFDGGETPIPGATVILTGTLATGGTATPLTTTTDGTGAYSFTGLLPGTYSVQEVQPTTPANLLTGRNTAGTVTNGTPGTAGAVGDDNIRAVVLNSFGNSPNNNFGEVVSAQLAGSVYEDLNDDGTFNAGDAALAGVTLVLTGTNDLAAITPVTVTTAADGSYSFTALRPGTYTVSETQPAGFLNRTNTAGATTNGTPGTVVGDAIQTVVLNSAGTSPGNNFGEVRPVQLSGSVYHDVNDDGTFDAGDAPLAGVTLVLTGTDDLGNPVTPATVTTAADGSYSFTNLRPGTYSVSETQPVGYTDRTNTPGTAFAPGTGTPGTVVGDVIQNVVLRSNANNPANNFGEVSAARVSGFVYEDLNNSNSLTNGLDRPIAGVTVVLTGTVAGGGAITPLTVTTAANGSYSFANLRPGTYTVTETQPAGFLNRGEQPGSTGGTAPQNGVLITTIPLAAGANSQNNNFGEVRPVTVAGNVYHDINDNGVFDAGDVLLPNTTLTLTGTTDLGAAVSLVQVTGGGAYAFTGLRPGTYTVAETQPAGFTTRTNTPGPAFNGTPGTVNGDTIRTITLRSDGNSPGNNFGETLLPATLSGFVYRDPNLNGAREPGNGNEPGIGNVTVRLFREDGPGVLTQVGQAQTDSNGFYEFTGLTAGLYRVIEAQPDGLYSTLDAAGTTGGNAPGNDTITTIPLAAGQNSTDNNFGEVPRTNLFGFVWVDDNRNGVFDPGEAPVPGAVVNINGTAFTDTTISQPLTTGLAQGPLTAITDANGRWDFLTLPPGSYNLLQTNTPAGLQDFRSQNASGQPVDTSTATTFGGVSAQAPAQGPLNFGKVSAAPTTPAVGPSKQNFLGSSAAATAGSTTNSLVDPAIGSVNTTPPFGISTGNPAVPAYVAVAAGAGFSPVIRVFDYATQRETLRIQAFEAGMTAGVRVATGDLTGDGVPDIIATVGPGGGPRVRVFDGTTGAAIRDFYAYPPDFRGGLYVAAADFNGDGLADIVTGAGEGGGPNVRVFDGATGQLLTSFFAFNGNQTGGARIAVGDFDGDGTPDIAASNGPGNTSLIRVFSGRGFGQIAQFVPYSTQYTGGVYLAAGDLDGDGRDELVAGADQGGGPNVRTFNATTGQLRDSFFAYESTFTGGVRVTVRDITGDGRADIITGAGLGGASRLRVFSGATLLPVEEFYAFDSAVRTGVYLG